MGFQLRYPEKGVCNGRSAASSSARAGRRSLLVTGRRALPPYEMLDEPEDSLSAPKAGDSLHAPAWDMCAARVGSRFTMVRHGKPWSSGPSPRASVAVPGHVTPRSTASLRPGGSLGAGLLKAALVRIPVAVTEAALASQCRVRVIAAEFGCGIPRAIRSTTVRR